MIPRLIQKSVDLDEVQKPDILNGPLYQLENQGHTFEITVYKSGVPTGFSGNISARFMRADGTTVYFEGSRTGNVVTLTLPQNCYTVNGRFAMTVFAAGAGVTSALYSVAGTVYRSTTDNIVDPEAAVPSVEDLMGLIDDCETATAAAGAAAAFLPNVVAGEYNPPYTAGKYCINGNYLYKALADIPATETAFTAAHWQEVKAAGEIKNRSDADGGLYEAAKGTAVQRVNLFDKTSPLNTAGQYWSTNGTLTTGADSKFVTSHPILVGPGTYKFNATTNSIGSNAAAVAVIDKNGDLVRMNNGTVVDSNTAVTVTFTETCLAQINFINTRADRLVFSKLADFPASVGYYSGIPQEVSETAEANAALEKALEVFAEEKNLFDKSSAEIVSGEYWDISGSNKTGQAATLCKSHPITIPAGSYKFTSNSSFGASAAAVAVLDSTGAMTRIIPATVENGVASFSVDRVSRVQFNLVSTANDSVVFCASSLWDGAYHAYGKKINNALLDLTGFVEKEDTDFFSFERSANLLDLSEPYTDKRVETSPNDAHYGELIDQSPSGQVTSFYVKLDGAGTYATLVNKSFYGGNANRIFLYDANKAFVEEVTGTFGESSDTHAVPLVFEVTQNSISNGVVYMCLVASTPLINSIMVVKSSTYPASYTPYYSRWTIPDITVMPEQIPEVNRSAVDLTGTVRKEDTTFFENDTSVNLLDLSEPNAGKYFDPGASGTLKDFSSYPITSYYVKLDGAGVYSTKVIKRLFGGNAAKICLFNSSKQYVGVAVGTLGDDTDLRSVPNVFEVTASDISGGAVYAGLTVEDPYIYSTMLVKSATYPASYTPYYSRWKIDGLAIDDGQAPTYEPNPLYGKEVLFDGDSICAPNTDLSSRGSYAGRIAAKNAMTMQNYAVSGGTLTSEIYTSGGAARHWVSATVDTMYAAHPDADYIIFEGGTNDADLIGSILNGNVPEKFGSFDAMDFSGTYDDETFCGAVETIIYKAMAHWPTKKIGFVIAPKMGYSGNSYLNRRAYFGKIMEICEKWGMPYLNLWDKCPINPRLPSCYDNAKTAEQNAEAGMMYLDGQHPTPTGYDRIAPIIEAWMKTL